MGILPRRPGWLLEALVQVRVLEEWSPIPSLRWGGQNPAYRPSGIFFSRARLAERAATPNVSGLMAKATRSDDWGFPRWRPYGKGREAAAVRTCDRDGCDAPGDRPAPKAPNSKERWYFCEAHAAEYNRNWNYFAGLDAEETAAREAEESAGASAFRRPAIGNGAGRATARAAATKCARWPCSSSNPTPISPPPRPRIAGSPRKTTRT